MLFPLIIPFLTFLQFHCRITIGIKSFLQRKLEYALCAAHYYKGLNLLCQKLLRMRDRNYRCPHVLLSRLNGC